MNRLLSFKNRVKALSKEEFSTVALELFRFQAQNNQVYRSYLRNLSVDIDDVSSIEDIRCLPIRFFKDHMVKSGSWEDEDVFKSSGTTGMKQSHHLVQDLSFYKEHALSVFKSVFSNFSRDNVVLALLPSYQAQGHSSLICMVDHLMKQVDQSKYCLEDYSNLKSEIRDFLDQGKTVYLFGVGYALLDFADSVESSLNGLIIIETGGMKGKRPEITKKEYYHYLKKIGKVSIFSEYGMTELMSQAYSLDEQNYVCPHSMKVLVRDPSDPFSKPFCNKTGVINVIDLANVHSCAFIETQDLGKVKENGDFEVLGRLDNSDIRGCNLLIQ